MRTIGVAQLSGPRGIAVSRDGYIFVAEENANRVTAWTSKGERVCFIGSLETKTGQLSSPWGVTLVSDTLVVSDCNKHCLQFF